MKASDLASKHQGPADCEARCGELGMHMGALVLVADDMPGCVCQPKAPAVENPAKPDPAAPAAPAEPPKSDPAQSGAAAGTVSYVVALAAAAATRTAQAQRQHQQRQQSYLPN